MEIFMKHYHEAYDAAKVNELLQRIKIHNQSVDIADRVTKAMKTCGYNQAHIDQVLKHLTGGDSP